LSTIATPAAPFQGIIEYIDTKTADSLRVLSHQRAMNRAPIHSPSTASSSSSTRARRIINPFLSERHALA